MQERFLTVSFKFPAGVSGWDLPHLKLGSMASRIIQDGCSGFQMCWQMGSCSSGVDVVSWRSWRQNAVGPAVVLEVGCVLCGCGIQEAGCNQLVWVPGDRAQSIGLGVLEAGSSQFMWGPQRQGVIGRAEGSWRQGSVSPARGPTGPGCCLKMAAATCNVNEALTEREVLCS